MKNKTGNHLNRKQIIKAVVDESKIAEYLRRHLSVCQTCRSEIEEFERQLFSIGDMARDNTPSFRKKLSLSLESDKGIRHLWIWHWRGFLAAGLTAAIVLVFAAWWLTPFNESFDDIEAPLIPMFLINEQFIVEIGWTDEDPLSRVYSYISGESIPSVTEEFMDFVIPFYQEETPGQDITKEEYHVIQKV